MHELATAHPERVSMVPLGHSSEGRELYALEIAAGQRSHDHKFADGRSGAETDALPLGFVVTGAQHAREVRSGLLSCRRIAEWAHCSGSRRRRLFTSRNHSLQMRLSLSHSRRCFRTLCVSYRYVEPVLTGAAQNFYIVPVPNPDGYVYTWEHDRFWCVRQSSWVWPRS
jgi:hypothetical protein